MLFHTYRYPQLFWFQSIQKKIQHISRKSYPILSTNFDCTLAQPVRSYLYTNHNFETTLKKLTFYLVEVSF